MRNKKIEWVIIIVLLLVVFAAALCFFVCARNDDSGEQLPQEYVKPLSVNSKIGVAYSVLGTTNRRAPECKNEGLSRYPVYGQTLKKADGESDEDFFELKQGILSENAYLNSDPNGTISGNCTNYDSMDESGYLYLNGEPALDGKGEHRRLYKHTAAENMYFGNVGDDQAAVIKQIKIQPRQIGNYLTGLYAPAGEVIKLTVSKADLEKVGSFYVYVGATLANGQANNIWIERDFVRMPVIANKMPVNAQTCAYNERSETYTCYFGSYLGGPIYIGSPSVKKQFQTEISGAVEYPHLIYGLTTEEEYNRLLKSSAPYFDLEVFDNAVRFSGPRTCSDKYSFSELCEAAKLWDKIARVSKQVPSGSNSSYGIDFLFEPFVAAGAAVAFVGRNTVNCPVDWMDGCLNVENFVKDGSWGNIHEFNHHFQNFGLPNGGEVTNNAVSLVEYSLFTKISSARSLDDSSLSGWSVYTDASRALRTLLENTESGDAVQSLEAYATVLHSFGQSVFIEATKNGSGADKWFKNLCDLTHYNFYYYFTELLHQPVSESVVSEVESCGYPMYVPVSCIYQTGTKYGYSTENRQITTMQPFEFIGDYYDFNVKSLINIPDGFTVTNVAVGKPRYGQIIRTDDDAYRFIPSDEKISGDIDVTISISKDDGEFEVEDVTLVFGFKKQQKRIAERTTYYFDGALLEKFEDVDDAVQNNYAGYSSFATFDNTFNGNECAAVWWNSEGVKLNAVTEYKSKIYIENGGTYRFSIRGKYANLYISLDGKNYSLVAKAGEVYNNSFAVCVENGEYADYTLKRGQTVYLKAVVMHVDVERCAFVLGMGTVADGKANLDDITKRITVYNANYQKETFYSDYFYTRKNDVTDFTVETDGTSNVVSTNFEPWDSTTEIDNLFDGNLSTFMHNKKGAYVTEDTPFEIVVDLGSVIKANKITMYGRSNNTQTPTSYRLYGGLTAGETTLLCEYINEPLKNGYNQTGYFEPTEFRYYKLVVTKTNANYICLSKIEFGIDFLGGSLVSPDDDIATYYGQWKVDFDLTPFGHGYTAVGGYMELDFVGTQIAVIAKNGNAKFSVSVDGSEPVVYETNVTNGVLFLSDELSNSSHKIVITPLSETTVFAFAVR